MNAKAELPVGVHADVPMADYLAIPAFSSGLAHTILSASPLHAWTESWLNPNREQEDSSVMDIGTYAHALLLEGGTDALVICPFDDWRKNDAKAMRDEARAAGKLPILQHKVPEVEAMVAAAKAYIATSEIKGVFDSGAAEQTIIWQDGDVLCKARPDWMNEKTLLHVKTTTGSVNPRAFSRVADGMGYDVAMMFYLRGMLAIEPDTVRDHYILAIEQEPPYACKLFDLSSAKADVAERKVERALNAWAACTKSGKWPAYDGSVHSIDLMPWELAQAEEDMQADESSRFTAEELRGGIPL